MNPLLPLLLIPFFIDRDFDSNFFDMERFNELQDIIDVVKRLEIESRKLNNRQGKNDKKTSYRYCNRNGCNKCKYKNVCKKSNYYRSNGVNCFKGKNNNCYNYYNNCEEGLLDKIKNFLYFLNES